MMRIWVRALGISLAAAVAAGAGQLGLAYGLGVVDWRQPFIGGAGWQANLTWVVLIAALAVVTGAVMGVRSLRRNGIDDGFGAWILISLAALAGGSAVMPLVTVPARAAAVPLLVDPAFTAGLLAGAGVVVGFFTALAVLCARPVAASVFVTAAVMWLYAVVSALDDLDVTGDRLGVLALPGLLPGEVRDGVLPIMVGSALLVSLALAGYSRWLGEHPVAIAASGLAGPALVASAYLLAGPGTLSEHSDPYRAALIAAGASVVTAALIGFIRFGGTDESTVDTDEPADAATPPGATDSHPVPMPTPEPGVVPRPRDAEYVGWVSGLRDEDVPTEELPDQSTGRHKRGKT